MTDYFALLQQPRRPWLDPDGLKQKYQELTLSNHPDLAVAGDKDREANSFPYSFAAINEAYRVLSDHKLRLRHLLNLEGEKRVAAPSAPPELTDLFMNVGNFLQERDRLIDKLRNSPSALSKSLLRSDVLKAQKDAEELLAELQQLHEKAVEELKQADRAWGEHPTELTGPLTSLSNRFGYLGRWIAQIRERQFQLAN